MGGRLEQLLSNSHSVILSGQAMEDLYANIMYTYRATPVQWYNVHKQKPVC